MKGLTYYIEKYALAEDPILTLDELLKMDDRLDGIKQQTSTGSTRGLELDDFQRAIRSAQLIPPVPTEVRIVFDGAKRLFIFGYFEYYFLTISLHYLFLAAESALRNIYEARHEKKERTFIRIKEIMKALVRDQVISESDKHMYESIISLRNTMSHLTQPTIFPATEETFERVAALINQLYDE